MPRRRATSMIPSMSRGRPPKCTGTMSFVRSVMAAARISGVTFSVSGSTSTSTGVAPRWIAQFGPAMKLRAGRMTSSPRSTPSTFMPRCSPAVHELRAAARTTPTWTATISSNLFVLGPTVSHPDLRVATTSAISFSPIDGSAKGRKLALTGSPPSTAGSALFMSLLR